MWIQIHNTVLNYFSPTPSGIVNPCSKSACVEVPNLETGKMEPLMAGDNKGFLTRDEELQFKSMINRLHNLFKVQYSSTLAQR